MGVRFAVDDVAPAEEALPTRPLGEVLEDAVAHGGDPGAPVVDHGSTHALLGAVHRAFVDHRPLCLSPDAVWLTIAEGVAQHVRLHADALRPRLVGHPGRTSLALETEAMPTDAAGWRSAVRRVRDALGERIGHGRARLFECDFSTSTEDDLVASQVVLADAYSPYFDVVFTVICGIPEVRLTGTVDDWRRIRARVDVVEELDLAFWTASLRPICDQLVRASQGDADVDFWRGIYKPRERYGPEVITGWVARLYPYLREGGRVVGRNPLLGLRLDEPADDAHQGPFGYDGPGVRSDAVASGPSRVRVRFRTPDGRTLEEAWLEAGVLTVVQRDDGALEPRCGWVARLGADTTMYDVVDRIRREHVWSPRRWDGFLTGSAEEIALFDQVEEATLFEGDRAWRIRAARDREAVEVLLQPEGPLERNPRGLWRRRPARYAFLHRLIDLPDGTFVARSEGVYVRCRADALLPPRPPPPLPDPTVDLITGLPLPPGHVPDRRRAEPDRRGTTQGAEAIPVVATSLTKLLLRALDSGGDLNLPDIGTLADHVRKRRV